LECCDGSYYTGFTDDLESRVEAHQSGEYPDAYTLRRRPVKLVFYYEFTDADDALAFEKQIKGWRRAKKKALINGEWEKLPELSVAYNRR
jgi:putative endonuclease